MKYATLVRHISERTGLTQADVRRVLSTTGELVAASLAAGEDVRLPGLASFAARRRRPRTIRAIHDARKLRIGERWVARARPARALRDAAASRGDEAWRAPEHQAAWRLAETLVADLDLYHRNRAPRLADDAAPGRVRSACEEAFGPLWQRVSDAWAQQVPPEVRASHDYLAVAARKRWTAAA